MAKILALMALVVAIAAPAALAADPVPADYKNAAKYCKAVRDVEGRRGVPDGLRHEQEQEERVRQVRLADGEGEGRQARGREEGR